MKHGILFTLLLLSLSFSQEKQKPNIIFLMADDLGWQDVGFMGSTYFETPHLDALAEESLVLENAFMYPTCSPSRAALLTGRQSFRTGSYCVPVLEKGKAKDNVFSKWTVTSEHPVYSQPLNTAGYQLIHLGKWHIVGPDPEAEAEILSSGKTIKQPKNGNLDWLEAHKTEKIQAYYPLGRGFHKNVGGTWWGDPARGYEKGYGAPGGGYIAPFKNPFIEEKDSDAWLTDRLTDEAITFMKENQEKPFFINLHYYSPHRPTVAHSEESLTHFKEKAADPETGQGLSAKGKSNKIAAYASMIKNLDDSVGRILTALDEMGARDNTILIFTSDNGFNGIQSANKRLRGAKGNVYDGGLRVPMLVHWKHKVSARKDATPVQGLDFFPTFLELAGVENYTETLDGESLLPLFQGEPLPERPLFWHIPSQYKDPPCSIIREGDWKLIQFLLNGKTELYNTREDLAETTNLSNAHPEKHQALLEKLTAWRESHNAPLPPSSKLER